MSIFKDGVYYPLGTGEETSEAEYEYQHAICQTAGEDPPEVWKTKDGREVHICDLGDDHLRNIVFLLWRRHEATVLEYCLQPGPLGEAATDAFDYECDRLGESSPERTTSVYAPIIAECAKRGWDVAKLEREAIRAIYSGRKRPA